MRLTWICIACLGLAACGPTTHMPDPDPPDDPVIPAVGESSSALIGDDGGELTLGAAALLVPAGAVEAETEVSVEAIDEALVETFEAFSPVFRFEPAGMQFAAPVTVRLPFDGDPESATIYWTTDDGQTYAALDTTVVDGVAVAETTHFSRAFVGTACRGERCCGRGRGQLDVLMMVDNSNSMTEEQDSLSRQIPHMARVLATGDLDGDGVQDFPAIRSLRIGSISSDMGTAGHTVPTCAASDFGDDGVLTIEGRTDLPGCAASYPQFAELRGGASPAAVDGFVNQVQCTARMGTGGCGFEQPLEAVLKAVTPSDSTFTFHGGTEGHADGANAGFLRPRSILATILMTDENDCSALDGDLFNPSSTVYTDDLNLRCATNERALHGATRYIEGLYATRSDPNDLVFGLIAGIPTDLAGQDPATINMDPRMTEQVDPMNPTRLLPSCETRGGGLAFPPRRMVDVAAGMANATVQSICQDDFTPVVDAILRRVADRAAGYCAE